MTMQEQLRALIERHLANLTEQLAIVTSLLTPAPETGTLPVAQLIEAQAITHQLKGTAGSMGFPDVGAAADALDESLKSLKTQPGPIAAAELAPALQLLATLQRIAEATTPRMSQIYNADLSQLAR